MANRSVAAPAVEGGALVVIAQPVTPAWHGQMIDARQVKVKIDSIGKRSSKLDDDTQAMLVQTVMHAARHGDFTLAGRLLGGNKLDTGLVTMSVFRSRTKTEALRAYVSAHSPLKWNGDGVLGMTKRDAKTYVPFNIEGMIAVPFWEHSSDKPKQALTWTQLLKIVEGMAKKIDEADADGRFTDDAEQAKAAVVAMLNAGKSVQVAAKAA